MTTPFSELDLIHRLAVAVRLFDFFTGETVRTPLRVTIPELRAQAFRAEGDGTYRFVFSNRDIPTGGPFAIQVDNPLRDYEAREAMQVSLPVVVGHPPPVVRTDYLREFPLWPTRRLRASPGETGMVGRILSGGATNVEGLRVFLFEAPGPAPPSPYAYTDAGGEFRFLLPGLRARMSGGVAVRTATLGIEVRDPGLSLVTPVSPGSVTVELGRTSLVEFQVP